LLRFYGETPEEGGTVEGLFATVLGFSAGLQKAAAEMTRHLVTPELRKAKASTTSSASQQQIRITAPKNALGGNPSATEDVGETTPIPSAHITHPSDTSSTSTLMPLPVASPTALLPSGQGVMGISNGRATVRGTMRGTMSRGELDEAIRSIHGGARRRERAEAATGTGTGTVGRGGGIMLSKMFLDGGSVRGRAGGG
jgi:hypothetical protein